MRDHVSAFARHLAARRSPRTIATYTSIVAAFLDASTCGTPTRGDVETFLARPRADGRPRTPATRNQEVAALRAFAQFAMRDLGWPANPTDGVPFAREAPRDPPVLSVFEVRRLFSVAATSPDATERARDLALLAILAQVGLRVHELVALDVAQVDMASATLVGVKGKGGTVHDLPLNAPTLGLVAGWLAARATIVDDAEQPALFLARAAGRISIRAVQRLLARLRGQMGTAKRITPHTLRHTTATLALTLGADLSTVADLLRHSDLNVTRRYLHLVDERRREAVGGLATAIPSDLLPLPARAAPTMPREPASHETNNVTPWPGTLDVQHGLGGARSAA